MDSEPSAPRRRLFRLQDVWIKHPCYFVTVCVDGRRPLLAYEKAHAVLREEWSVWSERHAWGVGPYVVMPDHVHFFAAPAPGTDRSLSHVVGAWKEWTAKRLGGVVAAGADRGDRRFADRDHANPAVGARGYTRLWQKGFFDHLLRGHESRSEKWRYLRENPVRAGLCATAEQWPFAGHVDFD